MTPQLPDLSRMSGMERAAVMMMALGRDHGRAIWQELSDDEIKELSAAMAKLGSVPALTVEELFVDFASQVSSVSSLHGSYDSTENLLTSMLPRDRVAGIMDEIRGPAGRTMWDKLGNVNEDVLAAYLKNEYPQTVAVVLGKIRPDHAARVLAKLPGDFGHEVIMRMLSMESVQKDILEQIENTLRTEFMSNLARTTRRDAHETMAEIFNHLDRAAEERFMSALEDQSIDAAEADSRADVHLRRPGAARCGRSADADRPCGQEPACTRAEGVEPDDARPLLRPHVGARGPDPA